MRARKRTSPILYEKGFKLKNSCNAVYYTACCSLVILKNSCSKLHCQKVLIYNPFYVRSETFSFWRAPKPHPNIAKAFWTRNSFGYQRVIDSGLNRPRVVYPRVYTKISRRPEAGPRGRSGGASLARDWGGCLPGALRLAVARRRVGLPPVQLCRGLRSAISVIPFN